MKKTKLKVLAGDPWDERSNFMLSTLWNEYHEFFKYRSGFYLKIIYSKQKYMGNEGSRGLWILLYY